MKFSCNTTLVHLTLCSFFLLMGCGINAPKQPHVRAQSATYTIVFADGVTRLTVMEKDSLNDFISVVYPSAVSNVLLTADDTNASAVARARSIRDYLAQKGFNKNAIRLEPSAGMDPRTVVVSLQYMQAVAPEPCPDWSDNPAVSYQESTFSNFGCASNSNFIVQLANPADYNGGHNTPVSEGPRDSAIMQKYFSGAASGGAAASSGGGTTTTTTSSP